MKVKDGFMSVVKKKFFRRGGLLSCTLNRVNPRYIEKINSEFTGDNQILNIGSGGIRPISKAINLDLNSQRINVDVIGDAHTLPFKSNTFDCIYCVAVLEHVKNPSIVISEFKRVLKLNGKVYMEMPFLQPFHGAPTDYYRTTIDGLREMMNNFEEISSGVCSGPGSTLGWILIEFISMLSTNRSISRVLRITATLLVAPLKYFDIVLNQHETATNLASGLYFYGVKKK